MASAPISLRAKLRCNVQVTCSASLPEYSTPSHRLTLSGSWLYAFGPALPPCLPSERRGQRPLHRQRCATPTRSRLARASASRPAPYGYCRATSPACRVYSLDAPSITLDSYLYMKRSRRLMIGVGVRLSTSQHVCYRRIPMQDPTHCLSLTRRYRVSGPRAYTPGKWPTSVVIGAGPYYQMIAKDSGGGLSRRTTPGGG